MMNVQLTGMSGVGVQSQSQQQQQQHQQLQIQQLQQLQQQWRLGSVVQAANPLGLGMDKSGVVVIGRHGLQTMMSSVCSPHLFGSPSLGLPALLPMTLPVGLLSHPTGFMSTLPNTQTTNSKLSSCGPMGAYVHPMMMQSAMNGAVSRLPVTSKPLFMLPTASGVEPVPMKQMDEPRHNKTTEDEDEDEDAVSLEEDEVDQHEPEEVDTDGQPQDEAVDPVSPALGNQPSMPNGLRENKLAKSKSKKGKACPHCGKHYQARSSYYYHILSHTQEAYVCPAPNCGKSFMARTSLRRHIRTCHRHDAQLEHVSYADCSTGPKL